MGSLVQYQLDDGIATLTMDDGKANVMSRQMLDEINAALDRAESEADVVVLAGRERFFSGGFDLAAFQRGGEEVLTVLEQGARLTERMLGFPQPVVAACTGNAVAMGAFLLLSADLRIGVDGDFRYHINEVRIGLTLPRFAIEVARQRLAPAHLQRAAVTGQPYAPREAVAAGFVDELAAPESLAATAREHAADLLRVDAGSFTATKRRLRHDTLEALGRAIRDDIADWRGRLDGGG